MRSSLEPVDIMQLELRCAMDAADFREEGKVLQEKPGLLIHRDEGCSVLGVAHLDFVGGSKHSFSYCNTSKNRRAVYNERLDDRLGAYLLLNYLPRMGLKFDLLLTDNEERGASTARDFTTERQYNWMFMFDRRGTDVVMYQYETEELKKLLEDSHFQVAKGSYTCIRDLEGLGCSGFNFGTGYHGQHTKNCYADLDEVELMADGFASFFDLHQGTKFAFDREAARVAEEAKWGAWRKSWKPEDDTVIVRRTYPIRERTTGLGGFEDYNEYARQLERQEEYLDSYGGGFHTMTDEEWRAADAAYNKMLEYNRG